MMFRKAILVIHGFGGGIYDEEYLINRLQLIKKYDVFAFTLPGHEGIKSLMKEDKWIEKTEEIINFLIRNGYKKIYVIGHSMGGVLAARLASKYTEVKKLVLLAAAFRYLEFKDDEVNVVKSITKLPGLAKEYKDEFVSRMQKMPLPSIKEFMNTVRHNEDSLKNIYVKTLIIQGTSDNLVPQETADFIYDLIPTDEKEVLMCEGVNHDIFRSNKKEQITKEIIEFLKK